MEIWDGYFRDGTLSGIDLIRGKEIPKGLYHMVCEVLVRHIDGDYLLMQRAFTKETHPGQFEATAGGSALKGEDKLTCIKRELQEETGIISDNFEEVGFFINDSKQGIFYAFICVTDWNKDNITLQEGETISFKWLSEEEFIRFVNSEQIIKSNRERYLNYFKEKKYILDA